MKKIVSDEASDMNESDKELENLENIDSEIVETETDAGYEETQLVLTDSLQKLQDEVNQELENEKIEKQKNLKNYRERKEREKDKNKKEKSKRWSLFKK